MAHVKGSAIAGLRAFLEDAGGVAAHARLRERLSPSDVAVLDDAIAVGWYPLETYVRAIDALGHVLARPADDAARAFGRFAAEHDLSTIHRLFLRLANPAYVLEKSGEYWGRFYDSGTWHVRREGASHVRADLRGLAVVDPRFCDFLCAYVRRMFELVGARDVRVAHTHCRAAHAEACTFLVDWH